jgi:hypothetical protein
MSWCSVVYCFFFFVFFFVPTGAASRLELRIMTTKIFKEEAGEPFVESPKRARLFYTHAKNRVNKEGAESTAALEPLQGGVDPRVSAAGRRKDAREKGRGK